MPPAENTVQPLPTTDDQPPQTIPKHRWRAMIVRLHFYAGVLVAPFLLVAAVTGGLYALAPTLERLVYGDILFVDVQGSPLPLGDQIAAAQEEFPGLTVSGIRPPAGATESTRVYFVDPALDEEKLRTVFVDPYTGRVLGDEPTWFGYLPMSTWLDGLHRHLNLGEPGRIYSELAASWLWVVASGGLYLWVLKAAGDRRRGRTGRLLTVDRSTGGRARTLSWHGATGVWLLAGLLFLSATGITWSTYAGAHVSDIRSAMNWQRPQLDSTLAGHGDHGGHGVPGPAVVDRLAVDYDGVLAAAAGAGARSPVEITVPAEHGHGVTVTEIDEPYRWTTNSAVVDPTDLSVTARIDYWSDYSLIAKLADWGIRAHMGFLFGLVNQLLLLGIAVGLVTLIVRGYRMWWQRRPTRGSDWAFGRPPVRGGMRGLSPVVRLWVIAAAVAVGWFLPLLGLSLAAFVAVDLCIGAVKQRKVKSDV
ncbi:Propeptide, PepSY amd peptidase M4 [Mycolicibacterium vanbaalenii PYR-1]|uniref:Propeptide, PepSY amd peptidase M4 n=1 Tax=Mycolicibacterium vanbaalenii (strain DSM 7251 / JCM 13017 / BCRC 16820 / KCTC 9966 / NRRL B-24157 / PYR-1) TaxID=350058 RepID=A1T724_MYCVP|nr:PepSY-associated TM helix domain-containing protein [Mycolicibacterium vanbaalenii]ABM12974.1 Propeptide, PepSY amd peptidase M4 [Mycolicibacterium vanbaalenii PYR-1]